MHRHDLEISAIKERLDHISNLLSVRFFDADATSGAGVSQPPFGGYPMDESIISRNWKMEFPFMTIQTPSIMILLGLDVRLAAQLVAMERTDPLPLTLLSGSSGFKFQYHNAVR